MTPPFDSATCPSLTWVAQHAVITVVGHVGLAGGRLQSHVSPSPSTISTTSTVSTTSSLSTTNSAVTLHHPTPPHSPLPPRPSLSTTPPALTQGLHSPDCPRDSPVPSSPALTPLVAALKSVSILQHKGLSELHCYSHLCHQS